MATHTRTLQPRGGAWGVSGIGVTLVLAALAHGTAIETPALYPTVETFLLVGLGGTVLGSGIWLQRSDLADRDLWRIAIWVSLGIILLVSLTVWQLLTQVQGGATVRDPLLTLVVTQTVGGTAGLLVGVYHVRSLRNARIAERATAEADAARARGDQIAFVHTLVRHHLRNGMQVIQSFAQQLEAHVDKEGKTHLRTIRRRSQRLVRLVEEMQRVAAAVDPDEDLTRTDVRSVIEREAVPFEKTHPESSITVTAPERATQIRADSLFPVAVENLLRCAIESSGRPGPAVEISIDGVESNCEITITASGPTVDGGIDGFFLRAASEDEDAGLHIAREILDRYNGSLTVEQAGSGPHFVVEIPLAE